LPLREDFVRFVEQHPRVAPKQFATIRRKLRHTNQQVGDAAFLDVPARPARSLLALAEAAGQPGGEGRPLTVRVTQTELAAMIGATRESANKWLGHFAGQGLIRSQRGHVTILSPEALKERIY
jgi:CRP/FNR family transcriptional regulator, cyclic AMP receptor protein